jgi:hypothetical protein
MNHIPADSYPMKSKKIIPAALNLVTLVGGHLYNKRYDRIVVFTSVLLVGYVASWFGVSLFIESVIEPSQVQSWFDNFRWIYIGQLAGLAVLLIISAVAGYVDSGKKPQPLTGINKWLTRLSGVALSGFVMYLLFAQSFMVASMGPAVRDYVPDTDNTITSSTGTRFSYDNFFSNGVSFKRPDASVSDQKLPDPPVGNTAITGEFHLDGKPIPGITFDMVLDGQYRAKQIQTDANGRFTIPIEVGTWHIDYLQITAWENKPTDRMLTLVTGREGKLNGTQFEEYRYMDFDKGLPVKVATDGEQIPPLVFPIRDNLTMLQPEANTTKQEVTTDNFNIRWQNYPGAKHYLVKISELKRKDNGVTYYPAARKKVTDATQLALTDLKAVPHDGEPLEYQVQVFAFDENNNYLSQSGNFFDESSFLLTDGKKIVDADANEMFDETQPFNAKDYEQMRKNNKRLDAVKILIEDKLYPEARTLLDKVQGKTEPGAKDAITAYLLAEQNQCEQAQKFFEKAKQASPSGCVPDCYMKNCQ